MKEDKIEKGEELIDIDEKRNPVEKQKERKRKFNNKYIIAIGIILCFILFASCYLYFNYKKNCKSIFEETTLKNLKLKNRVFLDLFPILLKE